MYQDHEPPVSTLHTMLGFLLLGLICLAISFSMWKQAQTNERKPAQTTTEK